jgi:hypothetical protein
MGAEQFQRWDPWWWFRDVAPTIIASVTDDWEGFRLILTADKCPDTRVLVPRGALVLYRVYDELGLLGRHLEGFEPGHCFYTVECSLLAKEASQMHGGTRDLPPVRHYAIYTSDRCVDIVSTQEPRFVLLREFASGRYNSERPDVEEN